MKELQEQASHAGMTKISMSPLTEHVNVRPSIRLRKKHADQGHLFLTFHFFVNVDPRSNKTQNGDE